MEDGAGGVLGDAEFVHRYVMWRIKAKMEHI